MQDINAENGAVDNKEHKNEWLGAFTGEIE
jgi:hypothetical protein